MREGWEQKKLGEVCLLINRGIAPNYLEAGGIAVLNQKCVRDHHVSFELGRRHDVDAKRVDLERYIRVGDVLVNSTGVGTLGRVAQVRIEPPEPTTVDTHVTIVRPEPELFYADFFGYMLILIEDEIARSGEGASGQTELARATLQNKFTVSFPTSISEQQRLVAILDEAFAELSIANANAERNLKNARELFDSYLHTVFSQKDEGWDIRALGDISKFEGGSQPPKSKFVNEPRKGYVRLLQIRDFKSDKHAVYIPVSSKNRTCKETDIMIGRYGASVGQIHRGKAGAYNVALIKTIPDLSVIDADFFYYYLSSARFQLPLSKVAARSAQAGFSKEDIHPFAVPLPNLNEQRKVVRRLNSIAGESSKLEDHYSKRLESLAVLKQAILQKAFSGGLTSPPSQAIKEAAE